MDPDPGPEWFRIRIRVSKFDYDDEIRGLGRGSRGLGRGMTEEDITKSETGTSKY